MNAGIGTENDAAASAGGAGSLNAKMRLLTTLLNTLAAGGIATGAVPRITDPVPGTAGHVVKELAITTSGSYAANDIVGGIVEITSANFASGRPVMLESLQINDADNQSAALQIYFFKETPAGGTYADSGAVTWHSSDSARKVGQISVATGDYLSIGNDCSANLSGLNQMLPVTATSLFMLMIATGTPNIANGALTLKVGLRHL